MIKNSNLHKAKSAKKDEFYTQLSDIEKELQHYKHHFKGKIIYSNCDSPESNFVKYFIDNSVELGYKEFIHSGYDNGKGDFRTELDKLAKADIVVTNPPFSLFREFIDLLMEYEKKFIVLGNNNAITYKEVFKYIKNNQLWLGVNSNKTMEFKLSDSYLKWDKLDNEGNKYGKVPAISWFTNLEYDKKNEELILYRTYNEADYPKYDNYDAIIVNKVKDIPCDYDGVMGVPITFLSKWNPEQFEILGITQRNDDPYKIKKYTKDEYINANDLNARGVVIRNGIPKSIYARILIKNKTTDKVLCSST